MSSKKSPPKRPMFMKQIEKIKPQDENQGSIFPEPQGLVPDPSRYRSITITNDKTMIIG